MIQYGFILILGREASVCEVAINVTPFAKATIVEEFQVVCDDEGDDVVSEAFFEHDEATHATVTILEGMNLLETDMKVKNVFEGLALDGVVFRE